jgi:hypothetical protein
MDQACLRQTNQNKANAALTSNAGKLMDLATGQHPIGSGQDFKHRAVE